MKKLIAISQINKRSFYQLCYSLEAIKNVTLRKRYGFTEDPL